MRTPRKVLIGVAATLGLLLAACGQYVADVPDDYVTLTVGLEDALAAAGIEPAGAPYSPDDGSIAVDNVQVAVFDKDGDQVKFDLSGGAYTASPTGSTLTIELTPGDPSADVSLPAAGNPYTFESRGYDSGSANVIAYDTQDRNVIDATTVLVKLESVLDQPDGAVLVPRYPTNYAMPGSVLDLMLVVMANGNAAFPSDYLQVPLSDFDVSYGAVTGGTVLAASERGLRIQVDDTCTQVTVAGTVSGLVENGTDIEAGTVGFQGDGTYEIACPAPFEGDVTADLEAPTVSIVYDSSDNSVSGTASDNVGIASVEVYDGPALVATTDLSKVMGDVVEVVFAPGLTTWSADLTNPPTGELTVIATDTSGNESSATTPFPGFVYVDDDYTAGDADGSEARPFPTVEQGLAVVAPGGTVYVLPGNYTATGYDIAKPLTLLGADRDTVTINTTAPGGYGIEVTADDVTLKGFTLVGPAGGAGNYGIKAFRNDGLGGLRIEDVTVTNYGRSEVDLNTVSGAFLVDVTADGNGTDGVGIALSGVEDVVLQGVHTLDNDWGGLGLFTTDAGTINGVFDVEVDASSIFEESGVGLRRGVYVDNEFGHPISGLRLAGFGFAVFAPEQRGFDSSCPEFGATDRGDDFIDFTKTLEQAVHLALNLCPATSDSAYIVELDTDGSGAITFANVFHVGAGMSIQTAIDHAAPSATVNLAAGTFTAGFEVEGKTDITIQGAGDTATTIDPTSAIATGVAHKYTADMRAVVFVDESSNVTLKDFGVKASGLTWATDLDALVFWNASSGSIQDLDIAGPGLQNGVQTGQGLAVDASAPLATNLLVQDTDFSGWNKNGIDVVNGNGATTGGGDVTVDVTGGTFTGGGSTGLNGQNGIVYWDRGGGVVTGTVDGVTISNLEYTGADYAAGILPFGGAVVPTVKNSTFNSVQVYIANATPNDIDATQNNTFDGVLGSAADATQLAAIEAKIVEDTGQVFIQ